jgi:hypothetical protein
MMHKRSPGTEAPMPDHRHPRHPDPRNSGMPQIQPIDYPARLEEMSKQLFKQGREPALCAADGLDLRGAANQIRRLTEENDRLRGEANGHAAK